MNQQEATPIEVEVLEIDGIAPVPQQGPSDDDGARQPGGMPDWRQWGGRVRTLDSRWWPLWVVLGTIALFLALTLGVVIGLVYAVFRIVRGFLRAMFR
jgi:hypothetical protein